MMTRRFFPVLLVALGVAVSGFAAVPDSVMGMIYYENNSDVSHSSHGFANVLAADGTYSQIYYRSFPLATPPFQLHDPEDGTYAYRKVDDTSAEITFTPTRSQAGVRKLAFRSDTEGQVIGDFGLSFGQFRLAPVAQVTSLLVNCSNRSTVNAGKSAFTGFVITGGLVSTARTVLVRAVGPGLGIFGITDFLRNPMLSLVKASDNSVVVTNDDWSSESAVSVSRTSTSVGAFPLPAGSKDAVAIVSLAAGAYIAQVSSPDASDSGQALIEVYLLP